jgi:hypothetical protein
VSTTRRSHRAGEMASQKRYSYAPFFQHTDTTLPCPRPARAKYW